MRLLIFISEKRNGTTKAPVCANISIQMKRPGYKEEDLASPMMSTKGVFITRAIEAWEEHIIACFDIPGTSLHVNDEEGDTCMLL